MVLDEEFRDTQKQPGVPIRVSLQTYLRQGVYQCNTESHEPLTRCINSIPRIGDRLMTDWTDGAADVWLWTAGGDGVMLKTRDPAEVKPFSGLTVSWDASPDTFTAGDIFTDPALTGLIHIGKALDDAMRREIQRRTGAMSLIEIQPGNPDDWRFDNWMASYQREKSLLHIFPQSGDSYLSFTIGTGSTKETPVSFYRTYADYIQRGGVICVAFMREAVGLTTEAIEKKYPSRRNYGRRTERQALDMVRITEIALTDQQVRLYSHLRLLPSDGIQNIYGYGWMPSGKEEKTAIKFIDPETLGQIGLLSEVFKFTGDTKKSRRLALFAFSHSI